MITTTTSKPSAANDPTKPPGTYDDIEAIDEDLAKALKTFCTSLFKDVIRLSAVKRRLNTSIDEHYMDFVTVNRQGRVPPLRPLQSRWRARHRLVTPTTTFPEGHLSL